MQIESWFSSGDVPRQAKVQVYLPDGTLLAEGQLDEKGIFVFSFTRAATLRVVISAGAGHRKELLIPEARLEQAAAESTASAAPDHLAQPSGPPSASIPLTDRSPQESVKDVLVGVGFLLALAAFVLSLRNARRLREFKKKDEG